MPTATLEAKHKLSSRLSADAVDTAKGVIRGATVAKSGVQATGKFVWLDADGNITNDFGAMTSQVPVFTDETTLSTLLAAAKAAGKRVKVREDHADFIGSRAGFADNFSQTDDGRVIADIHLLKSYEHREVVMETATETPGEIGLSIDFTPTFEIRDGKAMMRVSELHAVDIVDEGAITPDGLLLSAGVDTTPKVEPEKISPPAKMATQTPDEIMSAIGKLSDAVGTLTKTVGEMQTKMNAAPAAPAADPKVAETLQAVTELKTQLAATNDKIVQMKREKALLGFRGTSEERAKLASAAPEEIEKVTSEKKDYLKLVAERAESAKCKKSEAHVWVMKNHPTEYAAHLAGKGVIRSAA